jgi:hypothetical protein
MLQPGDLQKPLAEVHLIPRQRAEFANPQAVPIRDQDHGRVPVAVAAPPFGRGDQRLDLSGGQVLARASLRAALSSRWRCWFADNPERWPVRRRPLARTPNCPVSVLGIVSLSRLIAAESLASTGATVSFLVENGTLLFREKGRSCLTTGCECAPFPRRAAAFSHSALAGSPSASPQDRRCLSDRAHQRQFASPPGCRAETGAGGFPTWGYGTQTRARVPGEGKSQFCEKVNGRSHRKGAPVQMERGRPGPY